MNENRDETTGEYTAAEEPQSFGRDAELEAHGFTKMSEPEIPEAEELDGARAAADELLEKRDAAEPDGVIVYQRPDTGDQIAPDETVTVERAAADLTNYRNSKFESAALSIDKTFAAEIDGLRQDALEKGLDPKSTGIEDQVKPAEPAEEEIEPGREHVDPDLRRILKNPQAKAAYEGVLAQADEAKTQYGEALTHANTYSHAAILAIAPELQSIPIERWGEAIQIIAGSDAARGQQLGNMLGYVGQIQSAQAQQRQQQANAAYQQVEQHCEFEDQRLVEMVGKEDAEAATKALITYLDDHGVARNQRANIIMNNPVLRTAEARETIWKAAKYDEMMNTKSYPTNAVPPVQRPGVRSPRDYNADSHAELDRRIASSKGDRQVRAAADLINARRKAGR